jgi:hypothetical protein
MDVVLCDSTPSCVACLFATAVVTAVTVVAILRSITNCPSLSSVMSSKVDKDPI